MYHSLHESEAAVIMKLPFPTKGAPTKEGILLLLLEFCGGLFSFCRAQRNKSASPYALFSSSWLVARGNCQFLFFDPPSPHSGISVPSENERLESFFFYPQDADIFILMVEAGFGFFFPCTELTEVSVGSRLKPLIA